MPQSYASPLPSVLKALNHPGIFHLVPAGGETDDEWANRLWRDMQARRRREAAAATAAFSAALREQRQRDTERLAEEARQRSRTILQVRDSGGGGFGGGEVREPGPIVVVMTWQAAAVNTRSARFAHDALRHTPRHCVFKGSSGAMLLPWGMSV